ncbi:hypothetical protein L195_g023169, partial [Trifolium pratense]
TKTSVKDAEVAALVDEVGLWNMELLVGWLPVATIHY